MGTILPAFQGNECYILLVIHTEISTYRSVYTLISDYMVQVYTNILCTFRKFYILSIKNTQRLVPQIIIEKVPPHCIVSSIAPFTRSH